MTVKTKKKACKVKDLLLGCSYPALRSFNTLRDNARSILNAVKEHFKGQPVMFCGIGTSGATIMTAIIVNEDAKHHGVMLLAKDGESDHRSQVEASFSKTLNDVPIIIVDDLIASGNTMRTIQKILAKNHYTHRVKGVAICGSKDDIELLKDLFPNLELLIN